MIKASQLDIGVLVEFVKSRDVQPDWFSMQLPNGEFSVLGYYHIY